MRSTPEERTRSLCGLPLLRDLVHRPVGAPLRRRCFRERANAGRKLACRESLRHQRLCGQRPTASQASSGHDTPCELVPVKKTYPFVSQMVHQAGTLETGYRTKLSSIVSRATVSPSYSGLHQVGAYYPGG